MRPARLAEPARRDAAAAGRWIARNNPAAAQAFRSAIVAAARRIGSFPNIGTERFDLAPPPARFLPVQGFPYLIIYDADRTPPLILRIIHGARDLPNVLRDLEPS